MRTHALVLLPVHHHLSSLRNPKLILHLELAYCLTLWRRILIQFLLIASMIAHLPLGNRAVLCLIPRYNASKKIRRVEQLFRKEYQQLRERYISYFEAYTDGSNCEQKVAAATFYPKDPENSEAVRLQNDSSVLMPN